MTSRRLRQIDAVVGQEVRNEIEDSRCFECTALARPSLGTASPDLSSNSGTGSTPEPQTTAAAVTAVVSQQVRIL